MNSPAKTTTNAVTKESPKTFRDLITSDGYKNQIAAALPKGLSPDRLVRTVLTAINRTPKLLDCTKESLWQAVLDCSALGLFPDPLGRAYLVPYGTKCQLIVGYRGLIDLCYRSGMADSVQARCVYQGDKFVYRYGLNPTIEHEPCVKPGDLLYAYSIVHLKGAAMASFDVMSMDDVERIKRRSRASNDGPWVTDFAEMAKKTVLRRHMKMLPMATEDVARALELDNGDADEIGDAAERAAASVPARLKDDFGNAPEKEVQGTVVADPLNEAIAKAAGNGVTEEQVKAILANHGGGTGSVAQMTSRIIATSPTMVTTAINELLAAMMEIGG